MRWPLSAAEYPDPVPTSSTSWPGFASSMWSMDTISPGSVEEDVGLPVA